MGRALISDFEILSPIGSSISEFSSALFSGSSGIANLEGLYGQDFPVQAAGLIKGLGDEVQPNLVAQNLLRNLLSKHSRAPIDGLVFFIPEEGPRTNASTKSELLRKTIFECTRFELPAVQALGIHEACVSGLTGLALAAQRLRKGIWRRALVVGVDLRCSMTELLRFHALGALSRQQASRASCPFSLERDGFVRSQGAAAFLLEAESPEPWGEISGWGQTCDAWRLTEGRADGHGAIGALERALRVSGLKPSDIDCFSAHATSTQVGDVLEARAIKQIWGEARLPVTALKSQLGHSGQASGLLQVAAAMLMKKEECLAPTINFRTPDPRCDLDCVPNVARPARVKNVICNATAFGGQNASLVIT